MPFASHLAMSIGFFAGIIPAVIIIFMTLKEYDEYYEDKHFFFLLVLGLFAGTMTALIYYWSIIYLGQNLSLLTLPLIIVGFAIYEILLFTIVLSMKRFGGKYDLTYYGVVFGGSIGAVLNMFNIFLYLRNYNLTSQAILSMVFMVPTLPLLYISIGALVGFGLVKERFLKYSAWAFILKSIFNGIFIFWFIAFLFWPPERGWDLMVLGLLFAFCLYLYVSREHLPGSLPEHLQKHRRRQKRKQKRK